MTKNLRSEIIRIASIKDIARYYADLRRGSKSGRTLIGPCPFHEDYKRSFSVRLSPQDYICSACGETGDLFHLVEIMEGCSPLEAVRLLAGWYNLPVPEEENDSDTLEESDKNDPMMSNLLRECQMVYEQLKPYVLQSDELEDVYRRFEVGISPFTLPGMFNRLSNSIVFPVRNANGSLIAFTMPTLLKGGYLNFIPEELSDNIVLGLYQAVEAICRCHFAYLVFDLKSLLIMHAAGFDNTVALTNRESTQEQIRQLKEFTDHVVMIHKMDAQGQTKTFKVSAQLRHASLKPDVIYIEPQCDLTSLYDYWGKNEFICYIRKNMRISCLISYKAKLINQIETLSEELEKVKVVKERVPLRTALIVHRKKLEKVIKIIDLYPVKP